jgi:hypothetical protein
MSLRANSRHRTVEHIDDAYMTCTEAVAALAEIERLPKRILDPCCGTGTICDTLRAAGHETFGSDIRNYGWVGTVSPRDFLTGDVNANESIAIVSNPPYTLAQQFIEKAIDDGCRYHVWLLRLAFMESKSRKPFFEKHPPSRVWVSSSRLPMMHRYGWDGLRAASNIAYAWFVWDKASTDKNQIHWFDYQEI